jgi:phosphatidylinositol alpha-mannosyltransferase
MACGKPVIATSILGYASVLTHGDEGLLVPPRDEKSLANALLSLLHDKSLRLQMGKRGITKAEKYSWTNVARLIMDYYNSLLNNCA